MIYSCYKVATTEHFQFEHYLGEWGEKGPALSFSDKEYESKYSLMYSIQYFNQQDQESLLNKFLTLKCQSID